MSYPETRSHPTRPRCGHISSQRQGATRPHPKGDRKGPHPASTLPTPLQRYEVVLLFFGSKFFRVGANIVARFYQFVATGNDNLIITTQPKVVGICSLVRQGSLCCTTRSINLCDSFQKAAHVPARQTLSSIIISRNLNIVKLLARLLSGGLAQLSFLIYFPLLVP